MWTIVSFGRHKGKTLPQIILSDPDWFFWAYDKDAFVNRPDLLFEATRLAFMAKNIKIPKPNPKGWQVRYVISQDKKFQAFEIVEAGPEYLDPMHVILDDHLDLSYPRSLKRYDKLGYRLFMRNFRHYFFGTERYSLTKKRCEGFFEDRSNFLEPSPHLVPEHSTDTEDFLSALGKV
jgi:hypothetical protein